MHDPTLSDRYRGPRVQRRATGSASPGIRAFTLIELLVVVAIILVLLSISLPSLNAAKEQSRSTACASNLHQMGVALTAYLAQNKHRFPQAYSQRPGLISSWEIDTVPGNPATHRPGTLFRGDGDLALQQCPSFKGPDAWTSAPFTGYNYNTSYLGHGQFESVPEPAQLFQVKNPSQCVAFGDGGWAGGANKFMRAPWANPGDLSFTGRYAGAQAFRHIRGGTTVAYVDGSVETRFDRHTAALPSDSANLAPGTGFLSDDNSLYDLE
jgi:prepilin-type N-terminal cleavage/methylation domain-containing protein/prepilin-type processing-associated H-X9-DG protein